MVPFTPKSPKLQTCTTVSSIWSVTECQLFDVEVMVQLLGNIQTEGGRYCCVWQPEGDAWQVVFCQSDEFKMIWIFFHWCQGGFCGGKGPGWSKVIEKLWYCYQDHDDHDVKYQECSHFSGTSLVSTLTGMRFEIEWMCSPTRLWYENWEDNPKESSVCSSLPFEIYDAFTESNSILSPEHISECSVYTCESVRGQEWL